jgi:hypothetical protein
MAESSIPDPLSSKAPAACRWPPLASKKIASDDCLLAALAAAASEAPVTICRECGFLDDCETIKPLAALWPKRAPLLTGSFSLQTSAALGIAVGEMAANDRHFLPSTGATTNPHGFAMLVVRRTPEHRQLAIPLSSQISEGNHRHSNHDTVQIPTVRY